MKARTMKAKTVKMETKQLLVFGDKTFKITIPAGSKITFGPWSPPNKSTGYESGREALKGTLRVYLGSKDNIIACFSGVTGFRDLSMDYAEQVAKEEGAIIWKSDKDGYKREEKVRRAQTWVVPPVTAIESKPEKEDEAF